MDIHISALMSENKSFLGEKIGICHKPYLYLEAAPRKHPESSQEEMLKFCFLLFTADKGVLTDY